MRQLRGACWINVFAKCLKFFLQRGDSSSRRAASSFMCSLTRRKWAVQAARRECPCNIHQRRAFAAWLGFAIWKQNNSRAHHQKWQQNKQTGAFACMHPACSATSAPGISIFVFIISNFEFPVAQAPIAKQRVNTQIVFFYLPQHICADVFSQRKVCWPIVNALRFKKCWVKM